MNNMNIWKRIKIWFDPDHRLTVKHMTKNKVFEVASFNSKKDTRILIFQMFGPKLKLNVHFK